MYTVLSIVLIDGARATQKMYRFMYLNVSKLILGLSYSVSELDILCVMKDQIISTREIGIKWI